MSSKTGGGNLTCKLKLLVTQPMFAVFGQTGAQIDPLDVCTVYLKECPY